MAQNLFKAGLVARRRMAGFWLTTASATVTEICAHSGFDWLLLDMEHSANDLVEVQDHLRAAVGGTEIAVRVPWNEPVMVKRVLDVGARSLMFPFIQNVEEAKAAVAATRYPPHGMRGVSGVSRATAYGRTNNYAASASENIAVIVQLETPQALELAGDIAAVDGVDGVFIGPNDLAANMGYLGAQYHPEVREAMHKALAAIKAQGKSPGALDFKPDSAKVLFDAGFSFIAVGGDAGLLANYSTQLAAQFKQ